jgi:glyoxylase-like metal-dependent hydrolase (beta-lactamase superfamily II)
MKYLLLMAAVFAVVSAFAQSQSVLEARSTTGARYVEPSVKTTIMPGEKIGDLFTRNMNQPYILQRLTKRSYYFQRTFYSTTFYVGDAGVLLFDALEGRGDHLLKAIREVTPLPVTAVVYSHFHVDHVGDAQFWIDEARKAGITLRLVATKATAEKMAFMQSRLPKPNLVLSNLTDSFKFENVTTEVHRFAHPAHTDDHSVWLLKEEKVLHGPDLLNPDQLPMMGFAVSDTIVYHESNLWEAAALDWDYFDGGHGNIGSKQDFEFQLTFLNDLRRSTLEARKQESFAEHMKLTANNHAAFSRSQREAITKRVIEAMRPKYGQMYGFDASMPLNVELSIRLVGSYY